MRRAAGAFLTTAIISALAIPVTTPAALAAPQIRPNYQWVFSGTTYSDTSAGYGACNAQGQFDVTHFPTEFESWRCELSNPDPGVVNLWVLENQAYL